MAAQLVRPRKDSDANDPTKRVLTDILFPSHRRLAQPLHGMAASDDSSASLTLRNEQAIFGLRSIASRSCVLAGKARLGWDKIRVENDLLNMII